MKSKKSFALPVIIICILSIIYIILAARPLAKEFQFEPEWKISVASPVISQNNSTEHIYFKLGQSLGYFTENGEVTFFQTFPAMAAVSDNNFAVYNTKASDIDFYNSKGEKQGTIKNSGYPYFTNYGSFLFLPGGNSFSAFDNEGNILWEYENTVPITAFGTTQNYCAAGFADGVISVFNTEDGSTEIKYAPGGSDYPVILGLDISSDGKYIASISGHDKQRFVLSQKENQQQKIIFHYFIDKSSPYQSLVHFTEDDSRVFYTYLDNIGIYDLQTNKNYTLPVKDKIIKIEEADDLVFLLGKTKNKYTVYIVDQTNILEGSFTFEASNAFIRTYNNNLYIGKDTSISKIQLKRE